MERLATRKSDGKRRASAASGSINRWQEQAAMAAKRLDIGFEHTDHGQIIAGTTHADFQETGLRSERLGMAGMLFVNGCRRAPHLRGGNNKAVVQELGSEKLLGLDYAYIEGNRSMISLIRIDLDRTFFSVDHAKAALQSVVKDGKLPCMPHLICGTIGPARVPVDAFGDEREKFCTEALIRPHLWIELPYGSAVNAGPNGRAGPKNLLAGVARGINLALLHLGADPNASVFLVRGKNPLSPFLWSEALNNEFWPTLSEWAEWVDTRVAPEKLSRMAAELQSGLGKEASNGAFSQWQRDAYRILRELHAAGDGGYAAATRHATDADALAGLLREHMPISRLYRDPDWNDAAAERILGQVIAYAANGWDPAKVGAARRSRGSMRHITDGMPVRMAQAAAGRRSAAMAAERTLLAIIGAHTAIRERGDKPTQAAVAKLAGITRQTVSRRWSEVSRV